MSVDTKIRPLSGRDWDSIIALERRAYSASGLSEDEAVLRSRGTDHSSCFVLEHRGQFGGYLLALPLPLFRCPDLERCESFEGRSDNIHTHDMVIRDEFRGQGFGSLLLTYLATTAQSRGFRTASLVAVHGTEVLWPRLGYRPHSELTLPAGYGASAVYMSMELKPPSEV